MHTRIIGVGERVPINPLTTVKELKQLLADNTTSSTEDFRIIAGIKILEDSDLLRDYNPKLGFRVTPD